MQSFHEKMSAVVLVDVCGDRRSDEYCDGKARLQDRFGRGKREYITGGDLSCLAHMQGIIDREKITFKIVHVAQILAGDIQ